MKDPRASVRTVPRRIGSDWTNTDSVVSGAKPSPVTMTMPSRISTPISAPCRFAPVSRKPGMSDPGDDVGSVVGTDDGDVDEGAAGDVDVAAPFGDVAAVVDEPVAPGTVVVVASGLRIRGAGDATVEVVLTA